MRVAANRVSINSSDRLLTHEEAAAKLGLSPKAFIQKCYKGEGPRRVFQEAKGRPRKYLESDILELMQKHLKKEGEGF